MIEPSAVATRALQLQNALAIIRSHGLNVSNYHQVLQEYQQALDEVVDMIHDLAVYLQPEHMVVKSNN